IIENIESLATTLSGVEQPNMEDAFLALTTNELSVVRSIQLGFSSKEIALKMNTSYGAVESSRKNIRKKLGLQHSSKNLKTFLMSCSNV
ncbi:MAG: LuxR C-terminal-related transcriptional regulator, partial [Fibrobacterales bacterium]